MAIDPRNKFYHALAFKIGIVINSFEIIILSVLGVSNIQNFNAAVDIQIETQMSLYLPLRLRVLATFMNFAVIEGLLTGAANVFGFTKVMRLSSEDEIGWKSASWGLYEF